MLTGTGDRAFCAGHGPAGVRRRRLRHRATGPSWQAFQRLIARARSACRSSARPTRTARGRRPRAAARLRRHRRRRGGAARAARGQAGPVRRAAAARSSAPAIPLSVALELTLTGDPIDAARALAARAGQRGRARRRGARRRPRLRRAHRRQRTAGRRGDQGAGAPRRDRRRRRAGAAARAGSRWCSAARTPRRARSRSSRSATPSGRAGDLTCAPRGARRTARPRSSRSSDVDPPALGPGQARVRVEAAAVNFPDVLLVAGEYQIPVPPPFVPGSELAGEVVEVADDVDARRAPATGCSAARSSAPSPRRPWWRASALAVVPDGVDARRGRRLRRRPPHRLPRAPLGGRAAAGRASSSCSAPAAASGWRRCSSARVLGAR